MLGFLGQKFEDLDGAGFSMRRVGESSRRRDKRGRISERRHDFHRLSRPENQCLGEAFRREEARLGSDFGEAQIGGERAGVELRRIGSVLRRLRSVDSGVGERRQCELHGGYGGR